MSAGKTPREIADAVVSEWLDGRTADETPVVNLTQVIEAAIAGICAERDEARWLADESHTKEGAAFRQLRDAEAVIVTLRRANAVLAGGLGRDLAALTAAVDAIAGREATE